MGALYNEFNIATADFRILSSNPSLDLLFLGALLSAAAFSFATYTASKVLVNFNQLQIQEG